MCSGMANSYLNVQRSKKLIKLGFNRIRVLLFKKSTILFVLLWSQVFCVSSTYAQSISDQEKAILSYIDAHEEEAIGFLEQVVNINSGTMNHKGVKSVGEEFLKKFNAIGFDVTWVDAPPNIDRAGHLLSQRKGAQGQKLLLLGHLDTVFEADSTFQKFDRNGSRATGPGIVDMKSGNVIMLYALKALYEVGALENTHISILLSGDEERVGRPFNISRKDMVELGKSHDAALSFESGTFDTAVVARRSSTTWRLKVSGIRAHSSGIFNKGVGAGAIFEVARILSRFYDEVKGEEYLTFNPGVIVGGSQVDSQPELGKATAFGKKNIVASEVIVEGGIRALSQAQLENAQSKMKEIVSRHLPKTDAQITFEEGFPPMSPTTGNMALFSELKIVNSDLGLPELTPFDPGKRGAGDVSFVAPYINAIDGLGGVGGGSHSLHEELDLSAMNALTKRVALLIFRLTREK